jgi:hypothetical protein
VNEERRAELERLLSESDSLITDFFGSVAEPDDDLEDLLADSRADAAARFDSSFAGLRNSQYIVRIRRDDGHDLRIGGPSVRDVMEGVESEISAAAPGAHEEARIELDSLTRGSVVLHYRAARPFATVDDGQFDHGLSIVDSAISHVSALHRAIEAGQPVGQISQVAHSKELLQASKALLDNLQKHGLNISTRWRNATGERVVSRLTKAAKDHAAEIFDKRPKDKLIYVFGQVISASWDGKFVIKEKRQYEIAGSQTSADLIRLGQIRLGETVHVVLEEEVAEDRVGLVSRPRYRFVGIDDRLIP